MKNIVTEIRKLNSRIDMAVTRVKNYKTDNKRGPRLHTKTIHERAEATRKTE